MDSTLITLKYSNTEAEMLSSLTLLKQMYSGLTEETYSNMLPEMIAKSYKQIQAYHQDTLVGVVAYWVIPRLWLNGNSLDLDNFVVDEAHRSLGVGKILLNAVEDQANLLGCNTIVLDAYTNNFSAIKFYVKNDYIQKGFHFINQLK